MQNVGTEK